eukprot:UN14399
MKLKIRFEYSDKTSCFELKLFSKASRNFSCTSRRCSRYLQGPPNIFDYVGKKSGSFHALLTKYHRKGLGGGKYPPPRQLNPEKHRLMTRRVLDIF